MMASIRPNHLLAYAERAATNANPAAKALLQTMDRKKTNLCVSVDVTTSKALLDVVKAVGEYVCLVKTHIDIVSDFTPALVTSLQTLSKELDFLIFEDRKFADIGNTVSLQYSSGVHRIASWAHLTNAHLISGPSIIPGLAKVGVPLERGLLLLAEMSSKGALTTGDYVKANVEAARADDTGFAVGFIAQSRVDVRYQASSSKSPVRDFLVLSPGVGLDVKGDGNGQQYRTPDEVVRTDGADVIIVGRGIYGSLLESGIEESAALAKVKEQGERYRRAGWEAYERRLKEADPNPVSKRPSSPTPIAVQRPKRAKFVPTPLVASAHPSTSSATISGADFIDHALAATLSKESPRYSLRRRTRASQAEDTDSQGSAADASDDDFVADVEEDIKTTPVSGKGKGSTTAESGSSIPSKRAAKSKVKAEPADPFAISPRKAPPSKPIVLSLPASQAMAAPARWQEVYGLLKEQRRRIIAPVDTMGCQENGREDRRADSGREESDEDKKRRQRFTVLVSLMLSSQTKDAVTAEAVHNLQLNLPDGLCLQSILDASDDQISSAIAKVGFWRRKTGYIKSAARILKDDFDGDVPRDLNALLSLPGVGPKMAFLALQGAWDLTLGIGVDVHVHRLSNRLGWVKTKDPEGTRLALQSWLPQELHGEINKVLVGFGQVVCVPVGPRCDLCILNHRQCPSYRRVDPKAAAARIKVELLDDEGVRVREEADAETKRGLKREILAKTETIAEDVQMVLEGPDGMGVIKKEEAVDPVRLDW